MAALDWQRLLQAQDLPEGDRERMAGVRRAAIEANTHVEYKLRVVVAKPSGWNDPVDPRSLDRHDLEQFSEDEYRTIAPYRLGGLADTGAIRPIIRKPASTGDLMVDPNYAAWRARFAASWDEHHQEQPTLDPTEFPPEVAEQMLAHLEVWAAHGPNGAAASGGVHNHDENPPSLTRNQSRVLQAMARFNAIQLLTLESIAGETADFQARPPIPPLSARTVGPIVSKLIELELAERPGGDRSGARLTLMGRRLAPKIAD